MSTGDLGLLVVERWRMSMHLILDKASISFVFASQFCTSFRQFEVDIKPNPRPSPFSLHMTRALGLFTRTPEWSTYWQFDVSQQSKGARQLTRRKSGSRLDCRLASAGGFRMFRRRLDNCGPESVGTVTAAESLVRVKLDTNCLTRSALPVEYEYNLG